MSEAQRFIDKYNMDYRSIFIEDLIDEYLTEMDKGLQGKESSLLMVPSYLTLTDSLKVDEKLVCVDAGGTNLRITTAWFDEAQEFHMDEVTRYKMPGAEEELEAQEFFDIMADLIQPHCTETQNIVMSFAYPTKITSDIDAIPYYLTKEVQVKDIAGKPIAREITASLKKKGVSHPKMIVLNDTTASALAGRADYGKEGYGAYTGTILGTGSNSCYPELVDNITKLSASKFSGVMVINTEAGSYALLPQTKLDIAFDKTTQQPGLGLAEKMTSGAYLGALCHFTLKQAAEEGVFRTKGIRTADELTTVDVSEYLKDGSGVIEEFMLNEEDEANARLLLQNIVLRAGRFAAVQMAAMAHKSYKQNNRLCMSIEGTTYERMPGLKEELHQTLLRYLDTQNLSAELVTIEHAVLKGCAIAGLSK